MYWSFLTLTGIGQPFEAVTAAGRVATVASILTALVVVPLQLANLVGAANTAQSAEGPAQPQGQTRMGGFEAASGDYSSDAWDRSSDEGRGGGGGELDGDLSLVESRQISTSQPISGSGGSSEGGGVNRKVDMDDMLSFRMGCSLTPAEFTAAEAGANLSSTLV